MVLLGVRCLYHAASLMHTTAHTHTYLIFYVGRSWDWAHIVPEIYLRLFCGTEGVRATILTLTTCKTFLQKHPPPYDEEYVSTCIALYQNLVFCRVEQSKHIHREYIKENFSRGSSCDIHRIYFFSSLSIWNLKTLVLNYGYPSIQAQLESIREKVKSIVMLYYIAIASEADSRSRSILG